MITMQAAEEDEEPFISRRKKEKNPWVCLLLLVVFHTAQ